MVVAYALAGTVDIDFNTTPIGKDQSGNNVFLKDIWPSKSEIQQIVNQCVKPEYFKSIYQKISGGTDRWNSLKVSPNKIYDWKSSTYIHKPPFFETIQKDLPKITKVENAYVLCSFGDSITTDHISPAGKIAKNSPAARYLNERNVTEKDFNTYGSRRGKQMNFSL